MAKVPNNVVRWRVEDTQWKVGTASLVPYCSRAAEDMLRRKVREGFEKSQRNVHVDSDALRASGRIEEVDTGLETTFTVEYGGPEYGVEYAAYEELLHPFLEPAMLDTLGGFDVDVEALMVGPFGA